MEHMFKIGDLVEHTSKQGNVEWPIIGIVIDIYSKPTHRTGVGPDKWLTVYYYGVKGPTQLEDWRYFWRKV